VAAQAIWVSSIVADAPMDGLNDSQSKCLLQQNCGAGEACTWWRAACYWPTPAPLQAIIASDWPVRDAFLEEEDQHKALGMLLLAIQSALEAVVYDWCLHAGLPSASPRRCKAWAKEGVRNCDWMLGCSCAFTIRIGAVPAQSSS
jgi:hypothetical protein